MIFWIGSGAPSIEPTCSKIEACGVEAKVLFIKAFFSLAVLATREFMADSGMKPEALSFGGQMKFRMSFSSILNMATSSEVTEKNWQMVSTAFSSLDSAVGNAEMLWCNLFKNSKSTITGSPTD
jgi:hypothetical protein